MLYLLLILFAVSAQQKKDIQVKFVLAERSYNQFYRSDERSLIQKQSALKIADILNENFPFFHFTGNESDKKLFIYLTSKDKGATSKIHETGFKFSLPSEKNDNDGSLYFTFRTIEDFSKELPSSANLFIDEIISTFRNKLESNKAGMVGSVLSRVEVSDDYFILAVKTTGKDMDTIVTRFYIAPLNEEEFRIAKNSELRIVTTFGFDIFDNVDNVIDAKVISCIKNIEAAHSKYNLPLTYPERSLMMEIIDTANTSMSSNDTISKKVYLLNYLPLINTGLELALPSEISN